MHAYKLVHETIYCIPDKSTILAIYVNSSDLVSAVTNMCERLSGQVMLEPCHPLCELSLFVPSLIGSHAAVVIYSVLLLGRNVLALLLSSSVNRCAFLVSHRVFLCNACIRSNYVMFSPTGTCERIKIILFCSILLQYS